MKNNKDYLQWTLLILLLLTPIVLWILPADFFDKGQSICLSKVLLNMECPGCGMTRAVMHLHHFQFTDAIFYNYGVVAVYPALVVVWFVWVKAAAVKLGLWKQKQQGQATT